MTDVNTELESILGGLSVKAVYASPSECGELPSVSYYTLTEKGGFYSDNEESITDVRVRIDIWADEGYKCGMLAVELNALMRKYGFSRELSLDIPSDGGKIFHRCVQYVKSYVI